MSVVAEKIGYGYELAISRHIREHLKDISKRLLDPARNVYRLCNHPESRFGAHVTVYKDPGCSPDFNAAGTAQMPDIRTHALCETSPHITLYVNLGLPFKCVHHIAVGVSCAVLVGDRGVRVKLAVVPAEIKRVITEVVHTGE